MSLSLTPAKRQHNHSNEDSNGKKFQKSSNTKPVKLPRKISSGGDVFRVLCPSSKVENVLGKESDIISQIRQETGAKVRIDDPTPGCDERVIFVMVLTRMLRATINITRMTVTTLSQLKSKVTLNITA